MTTLPKQPLIQPTFAPAAAVTFLNRTYQKYPLDDDLRQAIDPGNSEALFPRLQT